MQPITAFYMKIRVAHVEAFRTDDYDPFLMTINLTISSLHFTPTDKSKNNLIKSNVQGDLKL